MIIVWRARVEMVLFGSFPSQQAYDERMDLNDLQDSSPGNWSAAESLFLLVVPAQKYFPAAQLQIYSSIYPFKFYIKYQI